MKVKVLSFTRTDLVSNIKKKPNYDVGRPPNEAPKALHPTKRHVSGSKDESAAERESGLSIQGGSAVVVGGRSETTGEELITPGKPFYTKETRVEEPRENGARPPNDGKPELAIRVKPPEHLA